MKKTHLLSGILLTLFIQACSDFVEIDPPRTDLIRTTVFASDQTADAAALDMYFQMASQNGFGSGGVYSISFLGALSSDESLNKLAFLTDVQAFNVHTLVPANTWCTALWSDLYKAIYKTNAIIEGLSDNDAISADLKKHLLGEAYFIRGLCYFYLVNLYGDAPLVLNTDYTFNQKIERTRTSEVYDRIEEDLILAEENLANDYSLADGEKIRPTKRAATALLARASLYREDWQKAEAYSSDVINSGMFSLGALNETFLKNSNEAIFQMYPINGNAYDRQVSNTYSKLQVSFVASFETNDQRKVVWVSNTTATKYKSTNQSRSEYSTVIRLAELYLIRAEARAQRDDVPGAQEDLNVIRTRAGLPNTVANDKTSLLAAIEKERRSELFAEWAHRWMDLKRYQHIDDALTGLKPLWDSTDALFPIPESQILNDPSMTDAQNPGY